MHLINGRSLVITLTVPLKQINISYTERAVKYSQIIYITSILKLFDPSSAIIHNFKCERFSSLQKVLNWFYFPCIFEPSRILTKNGKVHILLQRRIRIIIFFDY